MYLVRRLRDFEDSFTRIKRGGIKKSLINKIEHTIRNCFGSRVAGQLSRSQTTWRIFGIPRVPHPRRPFAYIPNQEGPTTASPRWYRLALRAIRLEDRYGPIRIRSAPRRGGHLLRHGPSLPSQREWWYPRHHRQSQIHWPPHHPPQTLHDLGFVLPNLLVVLI